MKPKIKKKNKVETDVVVILDRSGSMIVAKEDHEGGLKNFIQEQKKVEGDCFLTFVKFDSNDPFELVYDRVNIRDIDESTLNLDPRGGTPLLDAVGKTLNHVEKSIPDTSKDVLVMIITDGMENSSREFTKKNIKDVITKKDNWTFMFLGAGIDSFSEASSLGINLNTSADFRNDKFGVRNTYANITRKVSNVRGACAGGQNVTQNFKAEVYSFNEAERQSMTNGEQ